MVLFIVTLGHLGVPIKTKYKCDIRFHEFSYSTQIYLDQLFTNGQNFRLQMVQLENCKFDVGSVCTTSKTEEKVIKTKSP